MSIYTGNGDKGNTELYNRQIVSKSDAIIELLGDLDELTSYIGFIKCRVKDIEIITYLENIQNNLMLIMTVAAKSGNRDLSSLKKDTGIMEKEIDKLQELCPKITGFILPGGNEISAVTDISRTVARRAERSLYKADKNCSIDEIIKIYMNRLSDYLFVLARYFDYVIK